MKSIAKAFILILLLLISGVTIIPMIILICDAAECAEQSLLYKMYKDI